MGSQLTSLFVTSFGGDEEEGEGEGDEASSVEKKEAAGPSTTVVCGMMRRPASSQVDGGRWSGRNTDRQQGSQPPTIVAAVVMSARPTPRLHAAQQFVPTTHQPVQEPHHLAIA
jgi:hypothetical protein